MSIVTTTNELIVETPRGPSIAGTRITVYAVMDYVKENRSKDYILRFLRVLPEQLDAALEYIEQHRDEVERVYARILQREAEERAYYEERNRGRSPFPPDMPMEERRKLMLEKLEQMKQAAGANNGNHDTA